VARETGVATQMGNFGRSSEGHRQTAEWIWDGAIGPVREVHAWGGAGGFATGKGRPEGTPDAPAGLNWDLWLGPAERRPYHPAYAPFNWRGWWAFGGGGMPDLAPHHLDPAFNALKLDSPLTVEATAATPVDKEVCSTGVLATYRFGPRGNMGPVTVYWYDGGLYPPRPDVLPDEVVLDSQGGGILIGDKGILIHETYGDNARLFPVSAAEAGAAVPKTIERITDRHEMNWVKAIKGEAKASSPIEYAAQLTETMLLGIVALRTGQGRKILYDGEQMRVTNIAEANQYLTREYRAGWAV